MRIRPAVRLRGRLRVPGDKSVSHRAAILASLAVGRTRIENFSSSADCASTLEALRELGVSIERDGSVVRIEGVGTYVGAPRFRPSARPLDCGNSGTTMRLLAGVLAAQPFTSTLTGDDSLSRRPMRRVIEPLELMYARVEAVDGHAPLRVEGQRPLKGIRYEMPVASAQVKSCILLAGLGAEGRTEVVEPQAQTRDHTERMLRWFGVTVETREVEHGGARQDKHHDPVRQDERHDGARRDEHDDDARQDERRVVARQDERRVVVMLEAGARLHARDLTVPGDISSAAFPLAAAAMLPGSELELFGVGLNPTRNAVLDVLTSLGAWLRIEDMREQSNEPVGDIRVRGTDGLAPKVGARDLSKTGAGGLIRGELIAQLIDELPVLAVVGTRVEGGLEIRDARELRVKESDRISATVANLRAMGAEVEEYEDGLRVSGPTRLRGARLQSFGDHRIAMAFAVAALTAEGETEIEGAEECVRISFPEFFPLLESLTER
ncbi:MAG: 3-phosphoshikimate 1-carboxyvinyltransferase [Acidobacteriota bacterium]|jgi:3-phosphoshikimate 1-carboxyvinyltransferase|nr:3-phosphoshikimate 1-carboxyvinyltransferase [Acidobacteriota bacterium]